LYLKKNLFFLKFLAKKKKKQEASKENVLKNKQQHPLEGAVMQPYNSHQPIREIPGSQNTAASQLPGSQNTVTRQVPGTSYTATTTSTTARVSVVAAQPLSQASFPVSQAAHSFPGPYTPSPYPPFPSQNTRVAQLTPEQQQRLAGNYPPVYAAVPPQNNLNPNNFNTYPNGNQGYPPRGWGK